MSACSAVILVCPIVSFANCVGVVCILVQLHASSAPVLFVIARARPFPSLCYLRSPPLMILSSFRALLTLVFLAAQL